jgi:hypothetical protein
MIMRMMIMMVIIGHECKRWTVGGGNRRVWENVKDKNLIPSSQNLTGL